MCMSPYEVFWDMEQRKYVFTYNPRTCDLNRTIIVPCGKCPECKKKWRTQLAQRVRYELLKYSYNEVCFVTLTVNDKMINEVFPNRSLNHAYFQKFMKRLRRTLEYHGYKKKIKYLVSGEYGEKSKDPTKEGYRPHFHLIIFGWKPTDMVYRGKSKKHYNTYKSKFLEDIWGAGFVDVGDVSEHTAPYMVKYITKFSEVKSGEFKINGRIVRKPYVVYPKKILGIEYFLENYRTILSNGFILNSKGERCGIPRSFLKYAENSDNIEMQELYELYKKRIDNYLFEQKMLLIRSGYVTSSDRYFYALEQGRVRRVIYERFKNKNR